MPDIDEALDAATWCLLGFRAPAGPGFAPLPFWSDGRALWATLADDSPPAQALAADPEAVAYVRPAGAGDAVVVHARARVFSLSDPVGLSVHGPVIAGAMAALALRHSGTLATSAARVRRQSLRAALRRRVAVRLAEAGAVRVALPPLPAGVAPALPAAVPSDVRRNVAGQRRVVVVDGDLGLEPATWDDGLTLSRAGRPLAMAGPVAVAVDTDAADRDGLRAFVLHGTLGAQGRLRPVAATWWRGAEQETVRLPASPTSGVTLPD